MNKKKKYLIGATVIFVLILVSTAIFVIYFNDDDANELYLQIMDENEDGRTFETSHDAGFGNEPGDWANLQVNPSYSFGLRFINVSIPKGARIIDSHVKLFSIGIPGHNHVYCMVYADNVDNAVNLSEMGCLNRSGRTYTNNSILWDGEAPYRKWVKTPSIKSIIQEIIDRPGWNESNAIAILFITQKTEYTSVFDNYAGGNPAQLYIKWEMPTN